MTKPKGLRPKHIPQRTCIACRRTAAKRELVRVVRGVDGEIVVDPTGKRAGRGAYICRNRACWDLALKRKALEHALRTTLNQANLAMLQEFSQSLEGSAEANG